MRKPERGEEGKRVSGHKRGYAVTDCSLVGVTSSIIPGKTIPRCSTSAPPLALTKNGNPVGAPQAENVGQTLCGALVFGEIVMAIEDHGRARL